MDKKSYQLISQKMSRTALRYAIEKMPDKRIKIMAEQRPVFLIENGL